MHIDHMYLGVLLGSFLCMSLNLSPFLPKLKHVFDLTVVSAAILHVFHHWQQYSLYYYRHKGKFLCSAVHVKLFIMS